MLMLTFLFCSTVPLVVRAVPSMMPAFLRKNNRAQATDFDIHKTLTTRGSRAKSIGAGWSAAWDDEGWQWRLRECGLW